MESEYKKHVDVDILCFCIDLPNVQCRDELFYLVFEFVKVVNQSDDVAIFCLKPPMGFVTIFSHSAKPFITKL